MTKRRPTRASDYSKRDRGWQPQATFPPYRHMCFYSVFPAQGILDEQPAPYSVRLVPILDDILALHLSVDYSPNAGSPRCYLRQPSRLCIQLPVVCLFSVSRVWSTTKQHGPPVQQFIRTAEFITQVLNRTDSC